jgi:hypothetical protein
MLTRRNFIQAAALTLPLTSCAKDAPPAEPSIGNLSPQQMEAVHKDAGQFENALNAVRRADVPYAVEPRFYPPV